MKSISDEMHEQDQSAETVLILRTCNADMTSHRGFIWPEAGPVEDPDWKQTPNCGYGLHGLLFGEGNGSLLNWRADARWLVVEVDATSVVNIGGKVKFPRGVVVHCGDRQSATSYLAARTHGRAIVGGTATAGYGGTATAGDGGTATAGDGGTATAGYGGTATAGYGGTATAGDRGTATAGYGGTATAGYGGILSLRWWDGKRYRIATFCLGEDGIEPNIPYRCEEGRAVKVSLPDMNSE